MNFSTYIDREGRAYDPEIKPKVVKEPVYVPVLGEELLAKIQAEKPKTMKFSIQHEFKDLLNVKFVNPYKEMDSQKYYFSMLANRKDINPEIKEFCEIQNSKSGMQAVMNRVDNHNNQKSKI